MRYLDLKRGGGGELKWLRRRSRNYLRVLFDHWLCVNKLWIKSNGMPKTEADDWVWVGQEFP